MSTPLTVTRIGHASQLIQIGGTRVLTDPWFTDRLRVRDPLPTTSTLITESCRDPRT